MHLAFICKSFSLGITPISEELSTLEQSLFITNFTPFFLFLLYQALFPTSKKAMFSLPLFKHLKFSAFQGTGLEIQLNTTKTGILSSSHCNI